LPAIEGEELEAAITATSPRPEVLEQRASPRSGRLRWARIPPRPPRLRARAGERVSRGPRNSSSANLLSVIGSETAARFHRGAPLPPCVDGLELAREESWSTTGSASSGIGAAISPERAGHGRRGAGSSSTIGSGSGSRPRSRGRRTRPGSRRREDRTRPPPRRGGAGAAFTPASPRPRSRHASAAPRARYGGDRLRGRRLFAAPPPRAVAPEPRAAPVRGAPGARASTAAPPVTAGAGARAPTRSGAPSWTSRRGDAGRWKAAPAPAPSRRRPEFDLGPRRRDPGRVRRPPGPRSRAGPAAIVELEPAPRGARGPAAPVEIAAPIPELAEPVVDQDSSRASFESVDTTVEAEPAWKRSRRSRTR